MDLFENASQDKAFADAPLAYRMRPRSLDEFVGQKHIVGAGKLLRRAIEADRITSLIFYGPPGTGKTSLAQVIANRTKSSFQQCNAVTSSVAELREIIKEAKDRRSFQSKRTILFIDEIHRFNKAQQDALLPDVEAGTITLIGATTQNPYFYINPTILSRSQIFQFKPLRDEELKQVALKALKDPDRGFGKLNVEITDEALSHIISASGGDTRRVLNGLELAILTTPVDTEGITRIDLSVAEESIQKRAVLYDSSDDSHYDTISAFIKSMRGSDPDAALFWLAKMLYAGEDPRFIARRIIICASEDVGNADPHALLVADAALNAVEFVGMPEAQIILAQAVTYIACAPKSNSAVVSINKAMEAVKSGISTAVPEHLRDSSYSSAGKLGRGKGYKYPHDYKKHYIKQKYMLHNAKYYEPSDQGYEKRLKKRMEKLKGNASTGRPDPSEKNNQK
ncbi:AAA family ATPase [Candidatus Poribacteria bacterium]|nr:AAA family ATPase [Candidatus Poribacteria bacterium]